MTQISAITTGGSERLIPEVALDGLQQAVRGRVLLPGADGYDESRSVWNAVIDKRPGLVVRCTGAADVIASVKFASAHSIPVSVRGGGHNVAGTAVSDRGLMLDLSLMKGVYVDSKNRTARALAGTTWGDFDHETQGFGLATTGGICSETGIAGVTLGGGFGWLMRKYGLALDNVVAFDIVTADGELRSVSPSENSELFSAVRGAHSNYGVVTSLEYQLHSVGPMVLAGMVVHPLDTAREVLRFFREYTRTAPEEMSLWAGLMTTPDGHRVAALVGCYVGSTEAAHEVVAPIKSFGPPMADMMQPMPYVAAQSMIDAAFPKGRRNYWRSSLLSAVTDDVIDAVVDGFQNVSSPFSSILIEHVGGAMNGIPTDQSAFGSRDAQYDCVIMPMWTDAADDDAQRNWADAIWNGIQSAAVGVYVNYLGAESPERVRAAYGSNYDRLAALKAQYDPSNLFSSNQNIPPK